MADPIGDNEWRDDWNDYVLPFDDIDTELGYDEENERDVRFSTPDEVAEWALDLGIEGFTYIVEYPDGTYGPYVSYE